MNRLSLFLASFVLLAVAEPAVRAQYLSGPALAPSQSVTMSDDTHCKAVRAGDTVNFALTIDDVAAAKAVYAELQMRPGRKGGHYQTAGGGLPMPDFDSLSGGGSAVADGKETNVYHFSFKVPDGVTPGVYHGVGVAVRVTDGDPALGTTRVADVTERTEHQIRSYCLAVFTGRGSNYPVVTDFKPGQIERK